MFQGSYTLRLWNKIFKRRGHTTGVAITKIPPPIFGKHACKLPISSGWEDKNYNLYLFYNLYVFTVIFICNVFVHTIKDIQPIKKPYKNNDSAGSPSHHNQQEGGRYPFPFNQRLADSRTGTTTHNTLLRWQLGFTVIVQ